MLPSTRSGRLLILIYHRVHAQPDCMFPGEVDAARFEWQMRILRERCAPISLRDAVHRLQCGSLAPRSVAVTFDDGYADNATVALPILKRYGVPATFFIAPGFLNGGRMWNDSIIEAVRRAPGPTLDLTGIGQGLVQLGPQACRGGLAAAIIRRIKHMSPSDRAEQTATLCELVGAKLPDNLMMTSEQVAELHQERMEIGAHTMTHPILSTLTDEQACQEIAGSRDRLQAIINSPVCAFAYPNGRPGEDYTTRDRNLVQALGFEFAPSTTWGVASGASDKFQLPRFTPWDRTPERWLARLMLAFRTVA